MKKFSLVLVVTLFLSLLASCSSTSPDASATPDPTPTIIATAAPSETISPDPENSGEPSIEPSAVVFKPCFAFDAIRAISEHHYGTKRGSEIDAIIQDAFTDMEQHPSDLYYRLFAENYTFEEIENMDLNTVAEVYPDCLKVTSWIDSEQLVSVREMFVSGFKILKEIDFNSLWEEHCLPLLTTQCEAGTTAANEDIRTARIMSDVRVLKPDAELESFTVYLTYFHDGASFQLTDASYLTSYESERINIGEFLWLATHELIHGVSNAALLETYKQAYQTDDFLKKTKYILYTKNSRPGDEEEFVVALEHFVSVRNDVRTESEAYSSISSWYGGCMPVAVIVFDELMKLGELPEDVNAWLIGLFENGTIKTGEIESKVESISPGFVERFMNRWSTELP